MRKVCPDLQIFQREKFKFIIFAAQIEKLTNDSSRKISFKDSFL